MSDKPKVDKSVSDPMPGMDQPLPAIDLPEGPHKSDKAEPGRINVTQYDELRSWAKRLGVSPDALRAAIKAVGPIAEDVRKHLGK